MASRRTTRATPARCASVVGAASQGLQAVWYWAQHAAGICGGLPDLGEQEQHTALSDLLGSLGSMRDSLGTV
jgi:hypothetical protein